MPSTPLRRLLVTAAVCLGLPFVILSASLRAPGDGNWLERGIMFVTAPLQRAVSRTAGSGIALWDRYVAVLDAHERLNALTAERGMLIAELAHLKDERQENARLRALLNFRDTLPETTAVTARIIQISPDPNRQTVRINRGRTHGLRKNLAVVHAQGLAGRVWKVWDHAADVLLITDSESSVPVRVQVSRERATLSGMNRGDLLNVEHLAASNAVRPGDTLVTSGLGDVFPAGIVAGKLQLIERAANPMFFHATATPAVEMARLEEVLVLVPRTAAEGGQ